MECGSELIPLARSDNMLVDAGNGIADIRKHCLDVGRTDEGHWQIFADALNDANSVETT
jgi:hypothetical protein